MTAHNLAQKSRPKFRIVTLCLTMVIAAIVFVQVRMMMACDFSAEELIRFSITCGLRGLLFGGLVGLHDLRRKYGVFCGASVGFAIGVFAGPVIVATATQKPLEVFMCAIAWAVCLIVLVTSVRFESK